MAAWRSDVLFLVLSCFGAHCLALSDSGSDYGDYEYSYGDLSIDYDSVPNDGTEKVQKLTVTKETELPLCCPWGQVYNHQKCVDPSDTSTWEPHLSGAPNPQLAYQGFPKCRPGKPRIEIYQEEVIFSGEHVFLPRHIQLHAISSKGYCITKIEDPSKSYSCDEFKTKLYVCLDKEEEEVGIMWAAVAISHLLILCSLVAYFCMSDLRSLQGQYMICFLISLLLYDLCLYPGSQLYLSITYVSCIALGAIKYFFFCGVFLWFNVMCFDIWRTLRCREDISGRRRFLAYSAYCWLLGAILTTVVLILPYVTTGGNPETKEDPVMEPVEDACKLRMEVNMILQITQTLALVLDLLFLVMATCNVCGYTKFGNGLPRCEAVFCLKQGWKLFLIMLAHTASGVPPDMLKLPVSLWMYVLLESIAIFGVFTYRREVLKFFYKGLCRSKCCCTLHEEAADHEKGQLTLS